ncbi:MAG: deaminase [Patescibacteria group bacterium]
MGPKQAVVAYVPVLHRGYLEFFRRAADEMTTIALLGDWIHGVGDLGYFAKDIRRMDARLVAAALAEIVPEVQTTKVVESADAFLEFQPEVVVMPQDHVSRELQRHFPDWFQGRTVRFEDVFLMWDRMNTKTPREIEPDRSVICTGIDAHWMRRAFEEAAKSTDWWRRIGAVAVRGDIELCAAHNTHFPTEYEPYAVGDPRFAFHKGGDLDKTSAGHAEALLIARAAAEGIRLRGADLYVTTFPCPPCAISIAESGIRRLFYAGGYSMVGAAPVLRSRGIELVRVLTA